MAIIAVTTKSPSFDSEIEPRFGRARHLLLVDSKTLAWEVVENPALDAGGGAGVQVAGLLSERGVGAVASGEVGPNAHAALDRAGIAMHRFPAGTTCREAIERVKADESAVGAVEVGEGVNEGHEAGHRQRERRHRKDVARGRSRHRSGGGAP